jgi:hypothetical protein
LVTTGVALLPSITQGGKLPVSNPSFWIRPVSHGVAVAVGVGVGVGVGVTDGLAVGVGVGVASASTGAWIRTGTGEPVLKKLTVAVVVCGAWSESNLKLYNVPQRIAFAFWFCAKVSVAHVKESAVCVGVHGVLEYPALFCVPSFSQPGC